MIRSIGFIMFMHAGCVGEVPNDYNGGYIWFDEEEELTEEEREPPVCVEVPTPYDWEPDICFKTDRGMCCQWKEFITTADDPIKDYEQIEVTAECRYDWCYDLWECGWSHALSACEGDTL